jgi:hypothetical protein
MKTNVNLHHKFITERCKTIRLVLPNLHVMAYVGVELYTVRYLHSIFHCPKGDMSEVLVQFMHNVICFVRTRLDMNF